MYDNEELNRLELDLLSFLERNMCSKEQKEIGFTGIEHGEHCALDIIGDQYIYFYDCKKYAGVTIAQIDSKLLIIKAKEEDLDILIYPYCFSLYSDASDFVIRTKNDKDNISITISNQKGVNLSFPKVKYLDTNLPLEAPISELIKPVDFSTMGKSGGTTKRKIYE